jgi:hypothetical protein
MLEPYEFADPMWHKSIQQRRLYGNFPRLRWPRHGSEVVNLVRGGGCEEVVKKLLGRKVAGTPRDFAMMKLRVDLIPGMSEHVIAAR